MSSSDLDTTYLSALDGLSCNALIMHTKGRSSVKEVGWHASCISFMVSWHRARDSLIFSAVRNFRHLTSGSPHRGPNRCTFVGAMARLECHFLTRELSAFSKPRDIEHEHQDQDFFEIETVATENSMEKCEKEIPKHGIPPCAQKIPFPGFVKRELHDQGQCEPCLYHSKGGCWYGDECRFCHFCTAEQIRKRQSRQHYMERAQRRERERAQAQGPLPTYKITENHIFFCDFCLVMPCH